MPWDAQYVEIHFACVDTRLNSGLKSLKAPSTKPPWLKTSEEIWGADYDDDDDENDDDVSALDYDQDEDVYDDDYGLEQQQRIPILHPEEMSETTISPARIPITTPKVTTTTSTTTTTTTTVSTTARGEPNYFGSQNSRGRKKSTHFFSVFLNFS